MGAERRRVAIWEFAGKISLRVEVFARLGRGGGDVWFGFMLDGKDCLIGVAAKGSAEEGGLERLCFLPRGGSLWRLLRTRGEEGSTGVLLLTGGGGAEREGVRDGSELEYGSL